MTNINKLKTSACIIFALLVLVLLRSPSHAYSTTTTWTHNGQAVQTIETCQETTYTEYITARVDVSHILAKLTRQEAEYLRQFFNAEASCGEYPTHTAPVTKKGAPICTTTTSAYCGDGKINQDTEQCDGGYGCTTECQIYNPGPSRPSLPTYNAPVYEYDIIVPTGAGDMSLYNLFR